MSHKNTVDYILENSGTHFDPRIIPVFKKSAYLFDEIWEKNIDQ